MRPAVPTIHLNGSSPQALVDALSNASMALIRALNALAETAPHGRDYYPQGVGAYPKALGEHLDRMERLREVRAELEYIATEIIG